MPILQLTGFSGEIPRRQSRQLPDTAAQAALDTRLTSGGLEPIRQPKRVHSLASPPPDDDATLYRHDGTWRAWSGHVFPVPGPVAQDRLYVMGDGAPTMEVGGSSYPLALSAPASALTASVSGTGDGDVFTRLYVYTFVTEFDEESEPSPLTDEIDWEAGQTVTLSGFAVGDAARGVDRQRIYRSQTGPSGTQLYFIAERATTTSDFVDDVALEDIVEPLPSLDWTPPPDGLTGLVSLPGGMMAAFTGKDLYFCEPYRPHAWPAKYVLTVDYPIVALGAFGNSLVVATEGYPYLVVGTAPATMQMQKLEMNLPCINARGLVDLGYAVAYPSHEGLVVVDGGGPRLATESLYSRDDWNQIDPSTIVAGQYDGRYFASYDYLDYASERRRGTLILDLSGQQPFVIRTRIVTACFYYELTSGGLYYLSEGEVYQWDAPLQPAATQVWRSKEFVLPTPTNFGALLVDARSSLTDAEQAALDALAVEIQAENQQAFDNDDSLAGEVNGMALNTRALTDDDLRELPSSSRVLAVNVYADGVLRASTNQPNRLVRLPAGFKARKWEVEISGDTTVENVSLAGTASELRGA